MRDQSRRQVDDAAIECDQHAPLHGRPERGLPAWNEVGVRHAGVAEQRPIEFRHQRGRERLAGIGRVLLPGDALIDDAGLERQRVEHRRVTAPQGRDRRVEHAEVLLDVAETARGDRSANQGDVAAEFCELGYRELGKSLQRVGFLGL